MTSVAIAGTLKLWQVFLLYAPGPVSARITENHGEQQLHFGPLMLWLRVPHLHHLVQGLSSQVCWVLQPLFFFISAHFPAGAGCL